MHSVQGRRQARSGRASPSPSPWRPTTTRRPCEMRAGGLLEPLHIASPAPRPSLRSSAHSTRAPHPCGPLRARADCLIRRRPGGEYELHELHTTTSCQTVVRPARCPALSQRAFCLACNWVQPLLRACSPAAPSVLAPRVCGARATPLNHPLSRSDTSGALWPKLARALCLH